MKHIQAYSGKSLLTLTFSLAVLILTACQSKVQVDSTDKLPTHVAGAYDSQITQLQKQLNSHGVRIVTIGQDYLITIPSRLLFPTQSPQLTWDSYELLNILVCYLREFRKVNLNVTVFSSQYVSAKREHALTVARARAVADYLWAQDVDTRFIFTHGLGSDKPDGVFKKVGDGAPLSRIEITFRRAVA